MKVDCKTCGEEFDKLPSQVKRSPNHFCSRTCANKHNNKVPKRKLTNNCVKCGTLIRSNVKHCSTCWDPTPPDCTLDEAIYRNGHRSSAYALVRTRARSIAKKLGWNSCAICGYDKHIEIAHIKAINEFPPDTFISEINSEDNLMPLCPNHHWEVDHGIIPFPKKSPSLDSNQEPPN